MVPAKVELSSWQLNCRQRALLGRMISENRARYIISYRVDAMILQGSPALELEAVHSLEVPVSVAMAPLGQPAAHRVV
jgi:hypothetical protein